MTKHPRCDYVDKNGRPCNEPVKGIKTKQTYWGRQPTGRCSEEHAHPFRPVQEATVRGQRQTRPQTNAGNKAVATKSESKGGLCGPTAAAMTLLLLAALYALVVLL